MNSNSSSNSNSNSKTMVMVNQRDVVDSVRVRVPLKLLPSSSTSVSIPNKQTNCVHDCRNTLFLVQNHSNLKRSGPPARFMYYKDGLWSDFAGEVVDSLRSGFVEGKAVVEVAILGTLYLFDFYRMLQVDLGSGNHRSIAWIDVHGKCFFPKTFVGGFGDSANVEISNPAEDLASEAPNIGIEIEIRIGGDLNSTKRKRASAEIESETEGSASNYQPGGAKKKLQLPTYDVESPRWTKTKLLKEGEKAHSIVKNLFLSGMESVELEPGATITSIHQCIRSSGPLDRARYEVFQKQLEMTKATRGDAKMTFAWHGTSAKGVASILSHGFAMPSKVSGSQAHGVGIYLSPVRSPHISAMLSEVDDNGEKHVILCRVILGKCEKVEAGSQQMYPSSLDFDTGVDDLKNPKWYVVWGANMNTHILPECVVSYKSSNCVGMTGQLRGSSFVKSVPGSSTALSAKLFSKLGSSLPSSRVPEFRTLYTAFKDGKVAGDTFMKQLRSIVGDEMLVSTIREVCG